ncbi:uncharacterized protein LOC128334517 isoform X2 [Hemicordylus capensis]|uniref:uncharacterized protein LOC128334517 isoform X2 n=1 Tax=Hemicordylus capensis TaxID=884348 RepID=UPI00230348EA|nr:uncharacterized protein LOC128334517 isoform X2 [Hemicordylus capensis]
MSPQRDKTLLPLMLLIFLTMECSVEVRDPPLLVIQTPASLNVTEGSTLSMQCRIEGNISSISSWFMWYVRKTDGKWKVNDTVQISTKRSAQGTNLTLMTADVEDSGHYECQAGDSEISAWSNGTQVTVNEKQSDSNLISPGVGPGTDAGFGIGNGVRTSVIVTLLLLTIGVLVWKYKLKPKAGPIQSLFGQDKGLLLSSL